METYWGTSPKIVSNNNLQNDFAVELMLHI